jgi:DNA topoisomerase-2
LKLDDSEAEEVSKPKKTAAKKKATLKLDDSEAEEIIKPKKTAAKKKASLDFDDAFDEDMDIEEVAPSKKSSKASREDRPVEEIYQKKTQLEHILLRPDTYIGSTEPDSRMMWVMDTALGRMKQKEITFVPGLYKIFDEIIVNAADNKQRDASMDAIKVTIDAEEGVVSVWNNGRGIPVTIHKEHGIYVPELIFGNLLTSSNYDVRIQPNFIVYSLLEP